MADGSVVIDVILEDGTVGRGVANLDRQLGGLRGAGSRAAAGIKEIVTALGLVALAGKAIDMVKQSLDGAISRYDTLNTFPVVMQQIGFSAEDAQKAIDKLSEGIDGLPTTLDSVASTSQRIAVLTNDLEGATDTTLALNNAFVLSGSSSADAERGLTQYVQMLSKGSVDIMSWRTLQETMGVALNDVAKAFGFAGSSAQNDLYDALKNGSITFDEFNKKIVELDQTTGGFADRARESSGGIKTSWSNMKTAIVKGVADVIGAIDEALGGVGSVAGFFDKMKVGIKAFFGFIVANIPVVAGWISSVKDAFAPWIPIIQTVVDTVREMIIERLTTAVDFAKQIFASLKDFWQQNGQQILDNAITIFKGIWDTVQTVFDAIYSVISEVLGSKVVPFIQSMLENIKQFWDDNGQQIMQAVQNAFQFIKDIIEFVMPAIKFVIEIVWAAIEDIISGALSVIQGLIKVFTGIFTGDFSKLWEGIKDIFFGAIDLILGWMTLTFVGGLRTLLMNLGKGSINLIKNMWTKIVDFFKSFGTNVQNIVKGFADRIVGFFDDFVDAVLTLFNLFKARGESTFNAFTGVVKSIFTSLKNGLTTIWNGIKNLFTNTATTIKNVVTGIFNGLKNGISTIWGSVKGVIETIWNGVMDFFRRINLFQIGKDIIQGLINGIGSMASAVWDKVKSITDGIKNAITGALSIFSPSRWMRDMVGKNMMIGWIQGIDREKKPTLKKAEEMAEWMKPEVPSGFINRLRGVTVPLRNMMPISHVASDGNSTTNNNNKSFNPVINNHFTRDESTPSEAARKQKQQMQRLAMEWGY